MDIHQLRLLRELDARGSIAAVAAANRVTASAVSQHLTALQAEFRVPLTEKRARRTVLTDAGRALSHAAIGVETSFAAARSSVNDYLGTASGEVSVAAFHSAALAWFPGLLDESDATLQLHDRDVPFDEFPALTLDYDIVVAHRLASGRDWPHERVAVVPLLDEPIGVAVAQGHPLAGQRTIAPALLRDEHWVSVHDGFPLAGLLDSLAAAVGGPMQVRHRVNEFFVAAAMVRTGRAVALMPMSTMRGAPLDGVTVLEIDGLRLSRRVDALLQPQALQRRAVRNTLRLLEDVAAR